MNDLENFMFLGSSHSTFNKNSDAIDDVLNRKGRENDAKNTR